MADIHYDGVGPVLLSQGDRFTPIGSLSDHLEPGVSFQ